MKEVWKILILVTAFWVMWDGIKTFDNAHSWLEAFKGLFWMGVSGVTLWTRE